MISRSFLVTVLFIFVGCEVGGLYQKIIHNSDKEAVCLDGTPSLLYLHQGTQKKKFLIYLLGGGACGQITLSATVQSCYQRSKTMFGSSKFWPQTVEGQGYLSTNPAVSEFAEWTKVIFGYCDGALHQGFTSDPLSYKGTNLYFRGSKIVRSHLKWLNENYGLFNGDSVILTGGSAGGVGSTVWNNYLLGQMVKKQNMRTIIDSGIFLNEAASGSGKYEHGLQILNLYAFANKNESTPFELCNKDYARSQQYKCLLFQNNNVHLDGSILIIQSQYDSWTIPNILKINCLKQTTGGASTLSNCTKDQISAIEEYRLNYLLIVNAFIKKSQSRSIWSIACSNHVYAFYDFYYNNPNYNVPESSNFTIKTAIERFVLNQEKINQMDTEPWPSNKHCAY